MSTKLYRSSGNETRETSPSVVLAALAGSLLLRLFCVHLLYHPVLPSPTPTYRAGRSSIPLFSVPTVPTFNFECITGPPTPGWLFQSPVRWRYNDHRHMNHGPAETCIFMSAAHSLSLPLTLRLSFPQTYTDLPRLLRTAASPFLRPPISTVSCCLRNFGG